MSSNIGEEAARNSTKEFVQSTHLHIIPFTLLLTIQEKEAKISMK